MGTESSNRADRGTVVWEKQLVEDQRRGRSVDEKVIPFDRRAQYARNNNLPKAHVSGLAVAKPFM
jgi:hypothetical protein